MPSTRTRPLGSSRLVNASFRDDDDRSTNPLIQPHGRQSSGMDGAAEELDQTQAMTVLWAPAGLFDPDAYRVVLVGDPDVVARQLPGERLEVLACPDEAIACVPTSQAGGAARPAGP